MNDQTVQFASGIYETVIKKSVHSYKNMKISSS